MIKTQYYKILSDWMEIRQSDSAQRWRGQLLSLFLLGSLHVGLSLFLINLLLWFRSSDPKQLSFVYINSIGIVVICGLWWINRIGWNRAASIAFVLLGSLLPFLSVPSQGYERVLIAAAVPIVLASFLLTPIGSFFAFALQVVLYSVSFLQSGDSLNYNYFSIVAMVLIAFIAWVCASRFESSLSQAQSFQNRLRMVTENMVDVIGHVGSERTLLYASPSVQRMFGWEPKDLEGQSVFTYIHPDDADPLFEQVLAAISDHTPTIRQEFRYRCPNGDYKWVESETRLLYDPSGKYDGAVFGIRDISKRRQAEEAFTREHNLLRTVIDHLPVAVYAKDRQFQKTLSNRMDEEILGWDDVAEESPTPEAKLSAPDPAEIFHEGDRRVLAGEQILDLEMQIPDPRGQSRTLLTSRLPLRGPDDRIIGLVGIGMDITRLKRTEEELFQERTFLRTVIDTSPNLICVKKSDGTYALANKALAEVYGSTPEEMIGKKDSECPHPPEEIDRLLESDREVISHQDPKIIPEEKITFTDKKERWFTIIKIPLREEAGRCDKVLCLSMDITERKKAEAEIRRLNAELERRVEERTGQLEAANKELEAFAYSVSHDLRAPLRSIDGFSQALQEDYAALLDDQGQDFLQRICSASKRMGLLIDDLLQLSRLTRGELHRQNLDLTAMALRILDELRGAEPDRSVECIVAENLFAHGDERLLNAVLENLLGNAWKFTSRRKAAKVEFGAITTPEGEAAFFVKDNGAGFNMDHVDKLFHAFQRLHTVQEFPGNGIGLATVQRIIRRHGGRVWAEGEPEKGATFSFTLPQ